MRINQKELSAQEQELLIAVLDYSLTVGKTTFNFNKRKDYVKLDLSIPEMTRVRDLSEKQIKQLKDKIKELERKLDTLCSQNAPESERTDLIRKIDNLYDIIEKGKTKTPLLGMFDPDTRTIYLFLKNIDATGFRREALISTFIHEMFHAWNYFAAGRKNRTVEEIDEPMVEFGMLYFLKYIANELPEFASIHNWAHSFVRAKQDCVGITAAYGYGFYLYQLSSSDQKEIVLRILTAYGKKSHEIWESYAVKYLRGFLSPLYHHDKEDYILDLLVVLIDNGDYNLTDYIAWGKALHYLEDMTIYGDFTATCLLALCYLIGIGTYRDEKRVVELANQAGINIKKSGEFYRELYAKDPYVHRLTGAIRDKKRALDNMFKDSIRYEEGKKDMARDIATALKGERVDLNIVSKCTGLSSDQIEALK